MKPRVPYARIYKWNARASYQLTENDVLWAARAAVYEGGDTAATLWTFTQRFAGASGARYSSLAELVRAFSQPVNPDWAADGKFCRPGGQYHGEPNCSAAALGRRAEASSASWADLRNKNAAAVDIVVAWAHGVLPNPVPRATNFADPSVAAHYLQRNPDASLLLDSGNWYLVESWAQDWPKDAVTMAPLPPVQRFFATLWDALSHPLPRV